MPIPLGVLTREQIVTHALKRAGNTKDSFRTLATEALDAILFDLYTQWTWPSIQITTTLTLIGDPIPLPGDFLRPADDSALTIVNLDGQPTRQPVREVPREQWANLLPQDGVPQVWAVNYGFPLLGGECSTWPVNQSRYIIASLRYQYLPLPLRAPEDIPTFPWSSYLVQEVYCWALEYEGDPRVQGEQIKKELMMDRIRKATFPLHTQANDIPLDPLLFGRVFDGD